MTDRPMPQPTPISRPFWEACNRQELHLQHCKDCGRYIFYPRVCCPHCHGGDLEWRRVSGRGTVASFTKVHRPQHESFRPEAPIWFVAVQLEEGPILYSRLADPPGHENGLIGNPVSVVFSEPVRGQRLPYMALAARP